MTRWTFEEVRDLYKRAEDVEAKAVQLTTERDLLAAKCAEMKSAARRWAVYDGHHYQPVDTGDPCIICSAFSTDAGNDMVKKIADYRLMVCDLIVAMTGVLVRLKYQCQEDMPAGIRQEINLAEMVLNKANHVLYGPK